MKQMKHFSEEEWIEYQYGESGEQKQMQQHLAQCAECAELVAALAGDLARNATRRVKPE
jgi:hypothetical protein